MKIVVLKSQKDLFETSILEQSGSVDFLPYDDILAQPDTSCVVIGTKGIEDYKKSLLGLSHAFYKKGMSLILVNPPTGVDIGECIDAPTSVFIKKRKASSVCKSKIKDESKYNKTSEIWSDGVIVTTLSSGIVCIDEDNKCVLLKYQPKNTTGAVFITTLRLLSYSAMTIETDREEMIGRLLSHENIESMPHSEEVPQEKDQIESHILTAVAVLTYALNGFDISKIESMIPRFFDFQCDADAIQKAFEKLINGTDEESPETLLTGLENYIDRSGLYSYTREIQEILEEQEVDL